MKFNSQICTTREQSERLLQLGLKKETADMHYWRYTITGNWCLAAQPYEEDDDIPAWSLARIVELIDEAVQIDEDVCCLHDVCFTISNDLYDNLCDCIEWLINEEYFNKEYLV